MRFFFVDRVGAKSIWSVNGEIAFRLIQEGHQVVFVCFNDGKNAYSQEVPKDVEFFNIHVPPKKWVGDLVQKHWIFAGEFRALLRQLRPEVVHTNFAVPSIVARWVAYREKVPFILSTQHEMYGSMRFHYRFGLRMTERYCSAIVYVSGTVARSFARKAVNVDKVDLNKKPVHLVIPNGVDLGKIRASIAHSSPRVPGKLVCVGRMVPVKGQGLLLKALRRVSPRHPQVKLALIGSGPQEPHLRGLAHDLGLEKQVEFRGWLPHDQVLLEMASAGLIVVPSSSVQEGFGLVIAEGLVCGTPLLVSDTPLFHEVLDPFSGRGAFFAEGDPEALAEGLDQHLSGRVPSRSGLFPLTKGEESLLSAETMASYYLQLYQSLFGGKAK